MFAKTCPAVMLSQDTNRSELSRRNISCSRCDIPIKFLSAGFKCQIFSLDVLGDVISILDVNVLGNNILKTIAEKTGAER